MGWENKVSVNTSLTELTAYLSSLLKSTNMKCLTPDKALQGECGFMAANLYAKSNFGEDALANVSLEKNLSKQRPLLQDISGSEPSPKVWPSPLGTRSTRHR